ncbi:hypothetical protein B7R74_17865 [Yersinia pseudotuberculosis]|uniref:YceK/YidQ family lipoprotein n=1 Tax=Yersinia pseudotuberculosis TaxID=633 RepID=UPI000D0B3EE9|nr:YceK/YidQ family lipoprotein [Yersinia pseudotuberculosis]PSH15266.1 hypothetical protein B7R74_17865 [Yersinia pseudotuberculosis]
MMAMPKFILVLLPITIVLLLNGCTSIVARNTNLGGTPPAVYPGTVANAVLLPSPLFPLALIDLPLSFVADTLMLPFDIYHSTERHSSTPQVSKLKEKEVKTGDMYLTNMVSQNSRDEGVSFVEQGNEYYNKTPPNYAQALHLYSQAAAFDDAAAQFNLGNIYYLGRGATINYEVAYTWYLKSANSTDNHDQSPSNLNVGNMYYNGLYVKKDYQQAIEWYLKATKCHHQDGHRRTYCESALQARISLGDIYYNGAGVTKDLKTAFAWYALAQHLNIKMGPQKENVKKELSYEELKEAKITANKLTQKYGLAYGGAIFTDSQIKANH